ncbi:MULTISPECIES: hypothetical protein [Saccharopolyspora]|uniref:DUF3040 domain-containing protein n=1 Tax=Saccharopolyspora gregorii TaxID=33914 RepID=A0ABP6RYA3_9PSEU|nr:MULTISPECIES: hypothetical protein [Saccharopolyspora]MCA1190038.1 hypothetical protein [Saccharopolyspora sp. 6T]MCA1194565.1 hypothetical protein [Saccharopolyspora sp. 6V]MCA1225269.1 hypothetical protein [Saccharopolyspora sp. 6M]MCA1281619.1 hypothetical protein [Saccharopolyspora sp. 7B]
MADAKDDARSQSPDVVLLVSGALALIISASVLLGGSRDFLVEWSLAGVAVLVGVFLLVASMRHR